MDKRICPICQTEQEEFDKHHVVWKSEGGSDNPLNLLLVCKSCHALLTFGNQKDRTPRDLACFYFQMSRFGLSFVQSSGLLTSEFTSHWHCLADTWKELEQETVDAILKRVGRYFYQQYISVIQGRLSEDVLLENWWKATNILKAVST